MKRKTLLFFILCNFVYSITLAQNYIPFPDSGGVWKETYSWQPSPFFYNGIGDTYIEGDTVFNDTVYHKIYNLRRDVFCSDIIISGPEYDGALREDTINHKVYYRWNDYAGEKLLYDYTLQVGDTLPMEMLWFNFNYGVFITAIDTITTFDGVNRRVWYLDYYEPFEGWPQIVEGIGCTSGLLGLIEPYWEGWNELLCFSINNDVVWRSWRDTCYVITDSCASVGIDKTLHPKDKVVCYPNPVSSSTSVYFEIDQLNNFNNYLMVFDLYGKEISSHEFHNNFFTIKSPANNGVYIVKIFTKNNYYICKLIVTN